MLFIIITITPFLLRFTNCNDDTDYCRTFVMEYALLDILFSHILILLIPTRHRIICLPCSSHSSKDIASHWFPSPTYPLSSLSCKSSIRISNYLFSSSGILQMGYLYVSMYLCIYQSYLPFQNLIIFMLCVLLSLSHS